MRLAFFLFEMCVGMYFPMMGTMKGQIVPELLGRDKQSLFELQVQTRHDLQFVSAASERHRGLDPHLKARCLYLLHSLGLSFLNLSAMRDHKSHADGGWSWAGWSPRSEAKVNKIGTDHQDGWGAARHSARDHPRGGH